MLLLLDFIGARSLLHIPQQVASEFLGHKRVQERSGCLGIVPLPLAPLCPAGDGGEIGAGEEPRFDEFIWIPPAASRFIVSRRLLARDIH